MTERISISKGKRFEIFKRDKFTCQYCGSHPPEVVLHVDHIDPVANGGTNDTDNLITSCAACNLGKSDKLLSVVPQGLAEHAAEVLEREEQILGYQKIMQDRRDRIEAECWAVFALIVRDSRHGMNVKKDWFRSMKNFIEKIGYDSVYDAMEIASAKFPWSEKKAFMYFCGICWNRIREAGNGSH